MKGLLQSGLVFLSLLAMAAGGAAQGVEKREKETPIAPPAKTLALAKDRVAQDATVWAAEVLAQEHEAVIVAFWDKLRNSPAEERFGVFASLPVPAISLGPLDVEKRKVESGIVVTKKKRVDGVRPEFLTSLDWKEWLAGIEKDGFRIVQSEWHHREFTPPAEGEPAASTVNFEIHLWRTVEPQRFVIVTGDFGVSWQPDRDEAGRPVMSGVILNACTLVERAREPLFERALRLAPEEAKPGAGISLAPVIVRDLNGDVYPELILGGVNCVFYNRGGFKFERRPLFANPPRTMQNSGIVADFTGDGSLDFIGVDTGGKAWFLAGTEGGGFSAEARRAWLEVAQGSSALTAGDIDRDGDLDLWFAQYKVPYKGGQMPTPFHDANDGYPSILFINDGTGVFTDGTVAAGLADKRRRRTYSTSFVDLDDDRDLDLVVVSDFAGLDVWLNDGEGKFKPAPEAMFGERHGFGMAHTFGDFNRDGREDLYMVGMSSTTARRLDQLGLKREDFPDHARLRAPMAFGNRLYLARGGKFVQTGLNENCARAGWAWGAAAIDLENDGDDDLYVANGHISGDSATDYCTNFWRHDLYTGSSKEDPVIEHLLTDQFRPEKLRGLDAGRISWNGFEHNRLFLNLGGKEFLEAGFLYGVSYEADCRSVVAADLDADGKQDLLVVDHQWVSGDKLVPRQALLLHRNSIPTGNHWLGVRLAGAPGVSPLGAKVVLHGEFGKKERRIVTGDSFYAQHPAVAHFGLGSQDRVEKVEVHWPDGRRSEVEVGAVDRYLLVRPPSE